MVEHRRLRYKRRSGDHGGILLGAKGNDGIDARRAACRHIAGHERDGYDRDRLTIETSLQQFVISLRTRSLRPVTCNTCIGAMNAFRSVAARRGARHGAHKAPQLRVERRVLELLDETKCAVLIGYKPKTFSATAMSPIGAERHAASGCAQRC